MHGQHDFRIGDFHVEPLAGLIRQAANGGERHHVQPKIMHVLVHLAEHHGDVVRRDDLIEAVWDRPVTDEVLTRAIYELRTVFDDRSGQPHYIQTIPKIGYRLVAPVKAIDRQESSAESADAPSGVQPAPGFPHIGRALVGLAVIVAAFAAFTVLRRDSPIEFVDNDRVVLAEFENYTDIPRLGTALDIAFRTGLGQSRKLTVMPPAVVKATLARMQQNQESVNRDTAIEISLREQARAVIVASIAKAGDSYRLSGEILEPRSGRTVFTHQSSVVAEDRILYGLDEIVTAIRQESGEALSAIEGSAAPLEKVTTANFEALEAYSIGMQTAGVADLEIAIPFLEEAIRLDPTFAMAYANLGFLQLVKDEHNPTADWNLERALEYRDRLTRKERLYVEALRIRNEEPKVQREAWNLLIYSYPNFADAYRNLGNVYHRVENDFEKAAVELRKSVEIADSWNPVGFYNLAFVQLGLGDFGQSLKNFRTAWDVSSHPMTSGLAIAEIAAKNYADANEFLQSNLSFPADNVRQIVEATSAIFFLDQGKFAQAKEFLRTAMQTASGDLGSEQRAVVARCAILEREDDRKALAICLNDVVARELALFEEGYRRPRYTPTANLALLGKIAARNELNTEANSIFDAIRSKAPGSGYYYIDAYSTILEAELFIQMGAYLDAVQLLRPLTDSRALFQAHESLARAQALSGNVQEAIKEYQWLIDNRGRAFSEQLSRRYGNEFNILDWGAAHFHLARLYEQQGHTEEAQSAYQTLLEHWSGADVSIPIMASATERIRALSPETGDSSP